MDEKVKEIYSMCALYEPLAYDALQQFTNCNVPCLQGAVKNIPTQDQLNKRAQFGANLFSRGFYAGIFLAALCICD